jgi:hypothetical protein
LGVKYGFETSIEHFNVGLAGLGPCLGSNRSNRWTMIATPCCQWHIGPPPASCYGLVFRVSV